MSKRMRLAGWVMGAVAVVCLAGTVRADQLVYNANTDMLAQVSSGIPSSPRYEPWAWGYRATNDGVTSTNFTLTTATYYFDATWGGWQDAAPQIRALINRSGVAQQLVPGYADVQPNAIILNPEGGLLVNRWTAPLSGLVNIAATCNQAYMGDVDVDLVHGHVGIGTSLFHDYILGAKTNVIANQDVYVSVGDYIETVIGPRSSSAGDWISFNLEITYKSVLKPPAGTIFMIR